MIFNRKPNYKRVLVGSRGIVINEIEEQEILDEADDDMINEVFD